VALSILVWGAGSRHRSAASAKRNEIRNRLIELGHNAMFSEEIDTDAETISLKTRELEQARLAHLVVILVEDSEGALGEAHDFASHRDVVSKAFVLVPRKYQDGYSGKSVFRLLDEAYGGVWWYEEQDLTDCRVAAKAIARAEARRELEYQERQRG